MRIVLHRKTEQQLRRARKIRQAANYVALGTLVVMLLTLAINILIVRVFHIEVASSAADKIFLSIMWGAGCVLLFSCGIGMMARAERTEDAEVREHNPYSQEPIYYPASFSIRRIGSLMIILSILAALGLSFYIFLPRP